MSPSLGTTRSRISQRLRRSQCGSVSFPSRITIQRNRGRSDELGFSAFFLAEHHFHEYGLVPSPPTLLGAAAERTKRIGLGVAVSVLPFHQPLVAAEEYAMLDQMTGGRLVLGVGSGYLKHEFEGFYLAPWEKRARFDEALKIMVQAWEGKPFSYHGLYHHVENTRIAVTPLQKPHPPMWIAILRQEAAYHVGKQGQNIMLIPYATCETKDDLKSVIKLSTPTCQKASAAPGQRLRKRSNGTCVADSMRSGAAMTNWRQQGSSCLVTLSR